MYAPYFPIGFPGKEIIFFSRQVFRMWGQLDLHPAKSIPGGVQSQPFQARAVRGQTGEDFALPLKMIPDRPG
jgi:hypothetical protein